MSAFTSKPTKCLSYHVQENSLKPARYLEAQNNFAHVADSVTYSDTLDQMDRWILCDAVTSGGLLIAVAEQEAIKLLDELQQQGVDARIIGEVTEENKGHIIVS